MTAIGSINAGSRILASAMQGIAPLSAVKGTDESVTSSTTLQNDDALLVSVAANASYLFWCYLDYEGGTRGSSDLKFSWSVPSGTTLRAHRIGQTTAGAASVSATISESTSYAVGSDGAATLDAVTMIGTLVTSSTAGTLQLQWAQNTSSGTATKVHAQSFLALWQVS